ncbi:MAG: endospore germination permease [Eubacteriaceae bacterium]|nr:endospore germination permease [Eubacteriaceae bacterium]
MTSISKQEITMLQLKYLACAHLGGALLHSVLLTTVTGKDSWIIAFFGAISYLPFIFVNSKLAENHPQKSLFGIHDTVYGKTVGRALSFLYVIFYVSMTAVNLLEAADFVFGIMLPNTPKIVIVIFFVICCAYTVSKGIEPLAAVSTLIVFLFGSVILLNTVVALITHSDFKRIMPIMQLPLKNYLHGTLLALSMPYGESFFVMMLLPNIKDGSSIKKVFFTTTLVSMSTIFALHLKETFTLGRMVKIFSHPVFEAVKLVEFGDDLTRIEIFFAIAMLSMILMKTSVLMYICLSGFAHIIDSDNYQPYTNVFGAFLVVFSMTVIRQSIDFIYWGINVIPILYIFFQLALPLVTLLVDMFKKQRNKKPKTV